ncbi:MAG: hypothetical protein K2R98_06225 [Gemmataceae bacterium]|nr:hypothetical protein [Gemmataceae bacterium]
MLLDEGSPLREAIRYLHTERHIGKLLIVDAVVAITGMERRDAVQFVVHETFTT